MLQLPESHWRGIAHFSDREPAEICQVQVFALMTFKFSIVLDLPHHGMYARIAQGQKTSGLKSVKRLRSAYARCRFMR